MRFNPFPIAVCVVLASTLCAQRQPDLDAQRAAMKKLAFLVGTWSGDATVIHGPGKTIKVRQTEAVQYKLDGLLLIIEGTGRDPEKGGVMFNAFATIAYDETAGVYHFRAYNDGRYLDTELKVPANGFEWGYKAGPASVNFVMRLNEKGDWVETGDIVMGTNPPQRTFEMTVSKRN